MILLRLKMWIARWIIARSMTWDESEEDFCRHIRMAAEKDGFYGDDQDEIVARALIMRRALEKERTQ